uniref:Uncharacterized protein n=1 Tax=Callorhinchus milii TaxID=7868 RepID=A0A4W3HK17_CALMI
HHISMNTFTKALNCLDVQTSQNAVDSLNHLIWSGGSIPCAPLLLAVIGGHVDCIKFLIHKGANVNCVDDRGQSPLYIAAVNRNLNCIQILLQAAAKPNGSAHNRCTPLFFATRDGEVDIMRELINHGADINSAVHLSPKLYPNTLINYPTSGGGAEEWRDLKTRVRILKSILSGTGSQCSLARTGVIGERSLVRVRMRVAEFLII